MTRDILIKDNQLSTVTKLTVRDGIVVRKRYKHPFEHHYFLEHRNHMSLSGSVPMPHALAWRDNILEIDFRYAGISAEEALLTHGPDITKALSESMTLEIGSLAKLKIPFYDHYVWKNPYKCCRELSESELLPESDMMAIKRICEQAENKAVYQRYDPTERNFVWSDESGTVLGIDFAIMRCAHPLYMPAFFLCHITKPESPLLDIVQQIQHVIISEIQAHSSQYVATPEVLRATLGACLLEAFSYQLLGCSRKGNPPDSPHYTWASQGILAVLHAYEKSSDLQGLCDFSHFPASSLK
ncbi:hypothetical protein ACFLQR_03855 [Verrucomicrobiota bacterium]